MQTVEVTCLAAKRSQGEVELIDVRLPAEFREVHAEGAKNIPLDTLNPTDLMQGRSSEGQQPLYLICQGGTRSSKAAEKFIAAGYPNVVSVEGGTKAWDAAGLPVRRGRKAVSLERQVRITAGFLALLGAVLGYFVHPAFVGLSAFIGAGLMFAGITDTCGMGMMLAKMPWNRASA